MLPVSGLAYGQEEGTDAQNTDGVVSSDVTDTPELIAPEPVKPAIDYTAYDELMGRYAAPQRGRTKISFQLIREHAPYDLMKYIEYLVAQDISELEGDDLLAYMLNLQNAVAVQTLVEQKKLKKDLSKLRGTYETPGALWTEPRVMFVDTSYSLMDIEAAILEQFPEPDVIYGFYYGIQGAPSLYGKAYTGETVREALAENARRYVNSKGTVNVDNDVVELTPVFMWYKEDRFGADDQALIDHLQVHADPNLKSALYRGAKFETVKMNYQPDIFVLPEDNARSRGRKRKKSKPNYGRNAQIPRGGYGS